MRQETRNCQSCKTPFTIEPVDFDFYAKLKVPPPTWCPECRMIRRMVWRNERNLFRRPDSRTGEMIFAGFHKDAPVTVYEREYWHSDSWDPMDYGQEYDFNRPFFEQLRELFGKVPLSSRSLLNPVNADYSMNVAYGKNAYLCFYGQNIEDSAYVVGFNHVTSGFDLYQSRHTELCYDSYMVDESNKVFFSVNCEDSHDIWFSKNMIGCINCFGCTNLRNKSYHILNKPVSKEEYAEFMAAFKSGSYGAVQEMREKAEKFWMENPNRFTLAINTVDSTGEHIEHTKNVKDSYFIHDSENLRYCQMLEDATDSYDYTASGRKASQIYECSTVTIEVDTMRFSWYSHSASSNLDYCFLCISSHNNFACVGLTKKQYCIFNKQYSKEEYFALRDKIIAHMESMPYTDKQGRVYKYGEFVPPEFSPYAYNETIAQDFFPLTKEEAENKGYLWREPETKEFKTTIAASALPDDIKDADDSVLKEVITCEGCDKAYRIIEMELAFYRRMNLPLPHLCPDCRFARRFRFVNPPKLWHARCQCVGTTSDQRPTTNNSHGSLVVSSEFRYVNAVSHAHGEEQCPNEFETSFAPGRPEIIYCEKCYQTETV